MKKLLRAEIYSDFLKMGQAGMPVDGATYSLVQTRLADQALCGKWAQSGYPPLLQLDAAILHRWIEIRWRYWKVDDVTGRLVLDAKGKKIPQPIWCEGEVVEIADGESTKRSPRCKKLLPAGAVCVRWPADESRNEPESFTWCILNPSDFTREVNNGWRWGEREVRECAHESTRSERRACGR